MLDFLVGNDALSAIVAFGLVLIPAIFIHELGHFLAAKAVGITILEFGIGFPPRMLTLFARGETEYTLNWLPIGGFVRPLGEDFVKPVGEDVVAREREQVAQRRDPLASEREALRARGVKRIMSVNEAKPLSRIFFMAAGSSMNLLTAFLMFVLIGLMGIPTFVGGSTGILQLAPTSPLAEAGLQAGDLIGTVNGAYFDDTTALAELLRAERGAPVELTVQRRAVDEPVEITLVPDFDFALQTQVLVSMVAPESPAEAAGLQPDDLIVALNGERFSTFADLPERTQQVLGQEITLTILRDAEEVDVTLIPRANPPEGQGAIGIGILPAYASPDLGVTLVDGGRQQAIVPLTLAESVSFSFDRIRFFMETLIRLPAEIIGGNLSPEETRLMSPLAISTVGGDFLQQSIEQKQPVVILNYIAIISIALGITNLLPLPALDGGRIVFVVLEMVRGRPIAPEREGMVHLIGMALLLSLMVIAFINDIVNPVVIP
jgi:regulator of sigma E protease